MKKLFFVFLLFIGVGSSVLYYYWQQATQLPDWYTTQSLSTSRTQDSSSPSEIRDAKDILQAKIASSTAKSQTASEESVPPLPSVTSSSNNTSSQDSSHLRQQQSLKRKKVEIELNNQEVNELVTNTIAKQLNPSKDKATVPIFHTNIKEGVLESGTVINLSELSQERLPASKAAVLEKLQKTFPFMENQNIYVGISGKPRIENGQVKLDKNTKIKLGNLSFSLSEISQRLNIPQEQLEQKLNNSLQLGTLEVNDLDLKENKVLLRGSVVK